MLMHNGQTRRENCSMVPITEYLDYGAVRVQLRKHRFNARSQEENNQLLPNQRMESRQWIFCITFLLF